MFSFYPVSSAPFSTAKISGTVFISGVSASGLLGSVPKSDTEPLTSVIGSGVTGIVTTTNTPYAGISGVIASGRLALIGPEQLNSVIATGQLGNVLSGPVVSITGISATGNVQSMGDWYWTEINDDQLNANWTPITTL